MVSNEEQEHFHIKSVFHRDKDGNIAKISVEKTDKPRFNTPAYDEVVRGNKFPIWLRKKAD